jgi:hypothetical protein
MPILTTRMDTLRCWNSRAAPAANRRSTYTAAKTKCSTFSICTLKVFRGPEEITLRAGKSAFLPRNLPHTFNVISSYARALVYIRPGGFEGYFRKLGQQLAVKGELQEAAPPIDLVTVSRVAARYGLAASKNPQQQGSQ